MLLVVGTSQDETITAAELAHITNNNNKNNEQIIYESSNRRMKQLMDWLSNPHQNPDARTGWRAHVGLLTLLVSFTLFAGQQKGHPRSWLWAATL